MSHAKDATSRANLPELTAGEVIACRYLVESHDRSHPLGELYRCRDQDTQELVSLQRLRREFTLPGVQDRLFETRGSASLESKVIADIIDYGVDIDGRSFIVTPWSGHASLDAVERPLSFIEAATIVERVAAALAPLHAKGLLHGGIEPSSVVVDGQRELSGLLGFGLAPALAAAAERGRALPLLTSPAYAAPELITGQPLGPQTDVYALGILLWELTFGQPPFRGPTLRVLDSHLNRELPDVELPFDAPPSLEWTLGWMLAKNPADRFADAGKVAEQLRALMLEAPVDELEIADVEPIVEPMREVSDEVPLREATSVDAGTFDSGTFDFQPPRVWPKLVAVVGVCAALVLVSIWALGRERATAAEADQTIAVADYEPLALATSAGEPEPVIGEAIPRATRPEVPTLDQPPPEQEQEQEQTEQPSTTQQLRTPNLRKISGSKFRTRKHELYDRIQRECTDGNLRRTLEVAVRVDERGRVKAATVLGKMGDSGLGQCVERQARRLHFPASREGGYYVYTLRLRG